MLKERCISRGTINIIIELLLLIAMIPCALFTWKEVAPLCPSNAVASIYFFCCVIITILILTIYYLLFIRKAKIESIITVVVFTFGLVSTAACPPGMIPDEIAHIHTAYRYSNAMLFLPHSSDNEGIWRRSGDEEVYAITAYPGAADYASICDNMKLLADANEKAIVYDNSPARNNVTGPITYIPSAFGITLARLFGLSAYPMIYMGRIFNLLFFSACLYFTIKISPIGKYTFASVAILPMVIHLAGSFSGDIPVMGLSFLYIAYLLRMIYSDDYISKKDMLICCMLIFLIAPCKFVFCPLTLLPVLIPSEKFKGKKYRFILLLIAVLLGAVIVQSYSVIVKYLGSLSYKESTTINGFFETYSIGWVLDHPIDTLRYIALTVLGYGNFYFTSMLGAFVGPVEIALDQSAVILLSIIIVFSALCSNDSTEKIKFSHRALFVIIFGLAVLLSMLAMLVSWTTVDSVFIEGVQGRYFLPVLPLLLLAFGGLRLPFEDVVRKSVLMMEILIDVYMIGLVFLTIIRR